MDKRILKDYLKEQIESYTKAMHEAQAIEQAAIERKGYTVGTRADSLAYGRMRGYKQALEMVLWDIELL